MTGQCLWFSSRRWRIPGRWQWVPGAGRTRHEVHRAWMRPGTGPSTAQGALGTEQQQLHLLHSSSGGGNWFSSQDLALFALYVLVPFTYPSSPD